MGRNEKPDKKVTISVRVTPELKRLIDEKAAAERLTFGDIVDQGIRQRLSVPTGAWEQLSKASWDMQIPIHTIIMHKALAQVAFEAAWLSVFGNPPPATALQFQFKNSRKLLTGDELSNELYNDFKATLEEAKKKLEVSARGEATTISPAEMSLFLEGIKPAGA